MYKYRQSLIDYVITDYYVMKRTSIWKSAILSEHFATLSFYYRPHKKQSAIDFF